MKLSEFIDFPKALALNYKKMGITDDEYLILSITYQLMQSGTSFVNPSDLALLCSFSTTKIDVIYSGLISKKYISNELTNTGKVYTSFDNIINMILENLGSKAKENEESKKDDDIFAYMQSFFNRPLSPLEYDVIQSWKNNKYKTELIKAACDIASQTGNKSIRYIDTIIFEENKKEKMGVEEYQKNQQETIELSSVDWLNK